MQHGDVLGQGTNGVRDQSGAFSMRCHMGGGDPMGALGLLGSMGHVTCHDVLGTAVGAVMGTWLLWYPHGMVTSSVFHDAFGAR